MWEYKTVSVKRLTEITEFDEEGKNGWELVTVLPSYNNCGYKGIFKREMVSDTIERKQLND